MKPALFVGLFFVASAVGTACGARSGQPDAGPDGGVAPLQAPADQWTWVGFPDSHCGNGSATGIGFNPHPGSTTLLIYLEGGGACGDEATCWTQPTASYLTGYGESDFNANALLRASIVLDRTRSDSPFNAASMVYVPYCTGDLHTGTALQTLGSTPTYFNGGGNLALYLAALKATFPGLTRVYLAGASAGGYGSVLAHEQVQNTLGIPTDSIDDSGPLLALPGNTTILNLYGVQSLWGTQVPADCTTCDTTHGWLQYVRQKHPETRYGFVGFEYDSVVPLYGGLTVDQYHTDLQDYVTALDANARYFLVHNDDTSANHVVWYQMLAVDPNSALGMSVNSQMSTWLTQLKTGDAAWSNVDFQLQ